jgi:hypothetical protein
MFAELVSLHINIDFIIFLLERNNYQQSIKVCHSSKNTLTREATSIATHDGDRDRRYDA